MDNPSSTGDPVADLYAAEMLIREQHGIGAPQWRFWSGIADTFNRAASRGGPHHEHRTPGGWHEWNSLVDAARDYLDGGGIPR